jgi:hypothetical protein
MVEMVEMAEIVGSLAMGATAEMEETAARGDTAGYLGTVAAIPIMMRPIMGGKVERVAKAAPGENRAARALAEVVLLKEVIPIVPVQMELQAKQDLRAMC